MVRRGVGIIAISLVLLAAVSPQIVAKKTMASTPPYGGYVDRIDYVGLSNTDEELVALQNGDIDMALDPVRYDRLSQINTTQSVRTVMIPCDWYWSLSLNTERYPLNITQFRRAVAFAIDKVAILRDAMNNSGRTLEACIPPTDPFTAEKVIGPMYRYGLVTKARQVLANAGFFDSDNDSYLEGPGPLGRASVEFGILPVVTHDSPQARAAGQTIVSTLEDIGIQSQLIVYDEWSVSELLSIEREKRYFFFLHVLYPRFNDIIWMADEFWSGNADRPYVNLPKFRNNTFDFYRNQFLHASSYSEVYDAAIEMQRIVAEQCPFIPICQEYRYQLWNSEKLEDPVFTIEDGFFSWWTPYLVRLKQEQGGPVGGTFRAGRTVLPGTVILIEVSALAHDLRRTILSLAYDSLLRRRPSGEPDMWLARTFQIDTHHDDPNVPEGRMQIRFTLRQGFTWSDGMPVTSYDVKQTIDSLRMASGLWLHRCVQNVAQVTTDDRRSIVIEFKDESYWNLLRVGTLPVLPAHIISNWTTDQLVHWRFDQSVESVVTSGPFSISAWDEHSNLQLVINREHPFNIVHSPQSPSTPGTPDTTITSPPVNDSDTTGLYGIGRILGLRPISLGVTVVAAAVAAGFTAATIAHLRKNHRE